MYDVAESVFYPTYMLLSAFNDLVDEDHIPQSKPGLFGTYDPSSDRSVKTPRERYQEDKIILLETLPDFCLICKGTDQALAEDELIRGLRAMFEKREIWLVFAAQVFLDIHHVLREDVGRGYADLVQSAQLISHSILEVSSKGARGVIMELAPVAQVFKGRYCHSSGRIEWTVEDLERILARSNWETETEEEKNNNNSNTSNTDENSTLVLSRKPAAAARRRWQDNRQLSATQLLSRLRNSLQCESLELNFDYLMMHRFCWKLLRQVKEDCGQVLEDIFEPGILEREQQLPFIVGCIFLAAAKTQRASHLLFKKRSNVATSALLSKLPELLMG